MNLKFGTDKEKMEFEIADNSTPTDPNGAESHVTEGAGTLDTQNYNSRSTMYRTEGNVLTTSAAMGTGSGIVDQRVRRINESSR